MSREIYNKNAREKALLEEAYGNVYNEDVLNEVFGLFGKGALKAGKEKLKKKIKDKAQKKAREKALRMPKPDKKDVEQFKNQPKVTSGSSRTPKDVPVNKPKPKPPSKGDKVEDFLKTHPKTTAGVAGAGVTATVVPKVTEMGLDKSGLSEIPKVPGQVAGGIDALTDAANDALPKGFQLGKWALPAAAVGGGYLLAKSLSKDKDKDKEESEEGGGLRAAEQEMIQRAQAGEDPHAALDEVAGNHGVDKETLKKAIFGESRIYNKNAREKSLLEEAYASVYREDTEKEKRYEDRWDKDLDKEREKEGSSSAGDYSDVDKDDFCGPAGGAAPGTYPVDTEERAKAALSYARNAPDPEGIKRCVYRKAKKHGWFKEPEDEENPDAHTYSNLGREPGPAAELNPNIGFDEDEEQLTEGGPAILKGNGALGRWLFKPSAKSVSKALKKGKNIQSIPGRPLRNVGQGALNTALGRNPAGKAYYGAEGALLAKDAKEIYDLHKAATAGDGASYDRDLPAGVARPGGGPGLEPIVPSDEEVSVGAEVMFDGMMKSGQVEEVDLENGVAVVVDEDGGEHIVDLDNFDVVLNP